MNDDVDFEMNDDAGDPGAAQAKLKKLREELKEAQKKRDEYLEGWQRCKADTINARREAQERGSKLSEMLREELVYDIIPSLDSFDLAAGSESWTQVSDGFRTGMEAVRNQLLEGLRRHGIERYGKIGDQFDYGLHEAVQEVEDFPGASNTIAKVLRYGYRSKDKILRPAQVVVKR